MDEHVTTDLQAHLAELAAELDGVEVVARPDGRTCRLGATGFAVLGEGMAAFRLDGAIAAAAARTPDVRTSERGPGWIEFRPAVLDDHALDRAEAWLISAHRFAGAAPGRR